MAMGVLLVAGAKPKYIALISVLSLATLMAAFVGRFVNQYQIERLRVFLDQDTTNPDLEDSVYQVRNAVRAVGTGGVWGKGWLNGTLTNGGGNPGRRGALPLSPNGGEVGAARGGA